MSEAIQAASRIDSDGNARSVDNAYEEGIYAAVIGLEITDNPYRPENTLNRKLWIKGFVGVKNGTIRSGNEETNV